MRRLAAAVLAVAWLAACASPVSPSPPSSASPASTAGPSSTPAQLPPFQGFLPGDAIAAAVDSIPVHVDADEASQAVGDFVRGDVLLVQDFAVTDDAGRLWLYVADTNSPIAGRLPALPAPLPEMEFVVTGWIIARDGANPTVSAIPPRCPASLDLATMAAMLGSERLACFGSRSLTIEGVAGCGPCGADDGVYEPAWLAGNSGGSIVDPNGETRSVPLYLPPPLVAPAGGTLINVRGHFDDPRAAGCSIVLDGRELPQAAVIQLCRRHFVVEQLQVLPTQPPNPLE